MPLDSAVDGSQRLGALLVLARRGFVALERGGNADGVDGAAPAVVAPAHEEVAYVHEDSGRDRIDGLEGAWSAGRFDFQAAGGVLEEERQGPEV